MIGIIDHSGLNDLVNSCRDIMKNYKGNAEKLEQFRSAIEERTAGEEYGTEVNAAISEIKRMIDEKLEEIEPARNAGKQYRRAVMIEGTAEQIFNALIQIKDSGVKLYKIEMQ